MQLNIVYSIGKTASTSLFKSWASEPASLPVVHTHDMRYFCAVDEDNTPFVENIRANDLVRVFGERRPEYLCSEGGRYIEFRFALPSELSLTDVFPGRIFRSTKVIGITRNPVQRRISQFLNAVTFESINAYMDAAGIEQEYVDGENVLSALPALTKHVTKNQLLSDLIGIVVSTGKLPENDQLRPIFRRYFCGCDMDEYTPYVRNLCEMFPSLTNFAEFRRDRLQLATNGNAKLLLVAMESLAGKETRVRGFAGIRGHIRHDRVIEQQTTFTTGNISDTKRMLADDTTLIDLYPTSSRELAIVKALGYN